MKIVLNFTVSLMFFGLTVNANSNITNNVSEEVKIEKPAGKEVIAQHAGSFKGWGAPEPGEWLRIECLYAAGICWRLYDDFSIDTYSGTIMPPSGSCVSDYETTAYGDYDETIFYLESCP